MLSSRRFRKLLVSLLVAIAFIVGIFYSDSATWYGSKVADGTSIDFAADVSSDISKDKASDHAGDALFKKPHELLKPLQKSNPLLRLLLDPTTKVNSKIRLPQYLLDPESSENPHVQTFDPRFTFGLLLNYINRQIREEKHDFSIPVFHWADWTDLSLLDSYFFKTKEPGENICASFKVKATAKDSDVLPISAYCWNDADMAEKLTDPSIGESVKELIRQAQSSKYSSGFHIFSQSGRSTEKWKSLHTKAYLNEFMPPPYNVVLLSNDVKDNKVPSLKIPVAQVATQRQRLMDSSLVQEYIQETSNDFLDVESELQTFKNLPNQLKLSNHSPLKYRVDLAHEDFEDPSLENIKDMESRELTKLEDILYLKSLKYSTNPDIEVTKYFDEAKLLRVEKNWSNGAHFEWRFFNDLITSPTKEQIVLFNLLKAWLAFAHTNELRTWVSHGGLLSWYWNGLLFPWDNDVDVQMPIVDLHKLANGFNQSVVVDLTANDEKLRYGRYFIDCGTYISQRERRNGLNNIDARFVDMDTGQYIDITGLAVSDTWSPLRYDDYTTNPPIKQPSLKEGLTGLNLERNRKAHLYNCKNNHFTSLGEISPLRFTMIEGLPTYIINKYEEALFDEYANRGLFNRNYFTKMFLTKLKLYVERVPFSKWQNKHKEKFSPPMYDNSLNQREQRDYDPYIGWTGMHWIEYLRDNEDIFVEWGVTKDLTDLHALEREYVETGREEEAEKLFLTEDGGLKHSFKEIRHDHWSYMEMQDGKSFDLRIKKTMMKLENSKKEGKISD